MIMKHLEPLAQTYQKEKGRLVGNFFFSSLKKENELDNTRKIS